MFLSGFPNYDFSLNFAVNITTMGKGSKSKRAMNRLIKVLKRNRALKKAAHRTFSKPNTEENNSSSEE